MQKLHIQGDVALRVATLPAGAKPIEARPLALGEHSGHAHVVTTVESATTHQLFELDGKTFVVVGGDGAQLEHLHLPTGRKADHEAIVLAPNTCYEVILQNEYNPENAAFERVID